MSKSKFKAMLYLHVQKNIVFAKNNFNLLGEKCEVSLFSKYFKICFQVGNSVP